MSDDEMEDYGFEYSDDESGEASEDADIENQYYNAKGLVESGNTDGALAGFNAVVTSEQDKGEWGFKSLKQVVKIHFKNGDKSQMMSNYRTLLSYVSQNAAIIAPPTSDDKVAGLHSTPLTL